MAGTLTVQNLQGPSSGANANTVLIPSGQTLYAPGHVLQVVQAASTTELQTTTAATWLDVGAVLTITPTQTSSKIYLSNSATGIVRATVALSIGMRLMRNINNGGWSLVSQRARQAYYGSNLNDYTQIHYGYEYLDSPNTTQAIQYKVQINASQSTNFRYNTTEAYFSPSTTESTLIGQEIAG